MEDFQDQVRISFKACKSDIENLKVENSVLRDKFYLLEMENKNLKLENTKLYDELIDIKTELKGFKIALDFIKDFNLKNQNPSVLRESETQDIISEKILSKEKPIVSKQNQDPYEALLAFKAKANKREILKQKLISMIGENGMNLSELKFMFVEHFRYCSKASFYNYLKELEIEKVIKMQRENSKNNIYLIGIRNEI